MVHHTTDNYIVKKSNCINNQIDNFLIIAYMRVLRIAHSIPDNGRTVHAGSVQNDHELFNQILDYNG